jgi:site-specific DNA-cytosine methylase
MTPLAIDLFCGLGGWTEGLLAEGYRVVGFDIERHAYGENRYPAQFGDSGRADHPRLAVKRRGPDCR